MTDCNILTNKFTERIPFCQQRKYCNAVYCSLKNIKRTF